MRVAFFPTIKACGCVQLAVRASRFLTLETCQRPPRAVQTPRLFKGDCHATQAGDARPLNGRDDRQYGLGKSVSFVNRYLSALRRSFRGISWLPSFMPVVLREARAASVRSEISRSSFSAKAA
ncbi:hypothetical protein NKH36_02630 [Mesorhizobium sp. M1312]|uniref:hypothetical protein n=1 Tax=unclassified Mesorhizobium TaxID=325217 RepID=UPI00333E11D8